MVRTALTSRKREVLHLLENVLKFDCFMPALLVEGFLVLILIINFAIALAILLRDPKNAIHWSFFLCVLGGVMLGSGILLLFATKIFIFDKLVFYGGHTMILGLVLMAKTFPDNPKIKKNFWIFILPLAVLYIITPFNLLTKGLEIKADGSIAPINGPAIPFFVAVVGFYIFYSAFLFIKKYRQLSGLPKLQLQYLFLGAAIFMVSIFIFNVFLPAAGIAQLILLGPMSSIFFIGSTAYAILKHQLLNIRIIIQKSIIYVLILGLTGALYFATVFVVNFIFRQNFQLAMYLAITFAVIFGISTAWLVEKYFRKKVEEKTSHLRLLWEQQKQIIADISHGLQTPLTIIKSELNSIKKQSQFADDLDNLEKSVDSISKFIYDFLHLAKLETATEDFNKSPVYLSVILTDLSEYFEILAKENNISLMTEIQPNIVIPGNHKKIEELITNLMSNAVKYTYGKPDKKIWIKLAKVGDKVRLSIRDNGIGIGEEDLPHIFERFYRVKSSATKGTGLGLAICKKIVEKHNGSIEVSSELGKGTEFVIIF